MVIVNGLCGDVMTCDVLICDVIQLGTGHSLACARNVVVVIVSESLILSVDRQKQAIVLMKIN